MHILQIQLRLQRKTNIKISTIKVICLLFLYVIFRANCNHPENIYQNFDLSVLPQNIKPRINTKTKIPRLFHTLQPLQMAIIPPVPPRYDISVATTYTNVIVRFHLP